MEQRKYLFIYFEIRYNIGTNFSVYLNRTFRGNIT